MKNIVVTGGTGVLGRAVVARLRAEGREVRVVSRRTAPELTTADLLTGVGVDAALGRAAAVVHCATGFRKEQEQTMVRNLVAAARRVEGEPPHLVYISIVGIDKIPYFYYNAKLAAERILAESGLPFTILRATQFHDLVRTLLAATARSPLMPVVPGLRFQPVDVRDVATRLAELATAPPVNGRAADIGGPEVRELADLARLYLTATDRHRKLVNLPAPGRTMDAFRAGANLVPGEPYGTIGFARYLAELGNPDRLGYH